LKFERLLSAKAVNIDNRESEIKPEDTEV
jgi:Ulp1 family protease